MPTSDRERPGAFEALAVMPSTPNHSAKLTSDSARFYVLPDYTIL